MLKAIKNYSPIKSKDSSHFILDIKILLYHCKTQNIKISLAWIPSHINISQNEKVDLLAKNATTTGTNIICLLHQSDFHEKIKKSTKIFKTKPSQTKADSKDNIILHTTIKTQLNPGSPQLTCQDFI